VRDHVSRLFLAGLLVLLTAGPAAGAKALVYNATGEDLNIVINGRGNYHPWAFPAKVYQAKGKKKLRLETANTDGQLLTADLQPNQTYVILYQESTRRFVLWTVANLAERLNKILAENPANFKAAVFNATGRIAKFRFGPWEQGISREACVFTPNAGKAEQLKFEFIKPKLPPSGQLGQKSIHVLTYNQDRGYAFVSFETWVEELTARLEGRPVQTQPKPAAAPEPGGLQVDSLGP